MTVPSLFDETPPSPRAEFLAGVLAQWTFGDKKPKPAERARLEEIAASAIEKAGELKQ